MTIVEEIRAMVETIPPYGGKNTSSCSLNLYSIVVLEYFLYDVLCVASFNVPAPYLSSIEPALAGKVV